MPPVRHRTPSEPLADREQVLRDLRNHRQGTRTFLAQFAATRAQIDDAEAAIWNAWLTQPSTASATGARAGLQRLAAEAIARQLDASAASAITGQDPLVHQLSQSGREALQQPTGIDAAHQVQTRLAALDAEQRNLLLGRYRDRQTNAAQAQRLGWSPARIDAQLVSARTAVDWTTTSPANAEPEGLLSTLIEDHLAGTIDADSRDLLVKRLIDDLQFASRLERQARMDLVLGEVLALVDEVANEALADRLLSRGPGGPAPRPQWADDRRSAALPVVRRRKSAPIPMIGGVIAGAAALIAVVVLMAGPTLGSRTSDKPTASNTSPTSDRPAATTPPRSAPATMAVPAADAPITVPIPVTPITAPALVAQPVPVAPTAEPVTTPTPPVTAPTPVPIASAPTKPAATPEAIVTKPVFVKGIHFGGDAVTVDGNRWQAQRQAEDEGLTLKNARRVMVSLAPSPAVDADMRSLLISGITAAKSEPLSISLALPDGEYEVTAWMMENQRANSRLFDLDVGGTTLANVGDLPLGGWSAYGPCTTEVRGGRLEITSKARRGTPLLMGLAIQRTAASLAASAAASAKSYVADFSGGAAKDWTALGGNWSVSNDQYHHDSAEGIHLSLYDGATWGDFVYSASLSPHYDNGYGLVFGAQDAQTYDALYLVKNTASLLRITKGAKTQIAQATCLGTGLYKWSEVAVTRSGSKVSVTINGIAVFTDVELGEPLSGKIGLHTEWNPVDFSKIRVGLPKR